MKNAEEAIEKVFAGLRNPDVPSGIEHRILKAVQDRASSRSRSEGRRLRPLLRGTPGPAIITKSVAWGFALTGVLVVSLATSAIHRLGHAPAKSKRTSDLLSTIPPARSEVIAERARPPQSNPSLQPKRRNNMRRAELIPVRDSVAVREMRAPSRPEPPMPLTEQEKLLLRFVQTRSPEELAAINPVKWAARDAEEKAEFEKFFGQSTTGDKE